MCPQADGLVGQHRRRSGSRPTRGRQAGRQLGAEDPSVGRPVQTRMLAPSRQPTAPLLCAPGAPGRRVRAEFSARSSAGAADNLRVRPRPRHRLDAYRVLPGYGQRVPTCYDTDIGSEPGQGSARDPHGGTVWMLAVTRPSRGGDARRGISGDAEPAWLPARRLAPSATVGDVLCAHHRPTAAREQIAAGEPGARLPAGGTGPSRAGSATRRVVLLARASPLVDRQPARELAGQWAVRLAGSRA